MIDFRNAAEKLVTKYEADVAAETVRVAKLIDDHAVGDGAGYWKRLHQLRSKLTIARMIREALS